MKKNQFVYVMAHVLILNNNYKIKVQAKNEEVLKIEANDKKKLLALAWHIGNRHVPAEIHKDFYSY